MNISVIGLGKLGKPLANILSKYHNTKTYDINNTGNASFEECAKQDYIFIVVPTPHSSEYDGSNITSNLEPKDFDYSSLTDVLTNLNNFVNPKQSVIIVSTVLPGTTSRLKKLCNCQIFYSPFLIALDTVEWDIINPEFIMVGGQNTNRIVDLYDTFCICTNYVQGTYEEMETLKIFFNVYSSMKITLVNTIQDISMKLGNINVDKITEQLSKTKSMNSETFMKAGLSAGGPCLPRDVIAMKWFAEQYNMGYDLFGYLRNIQEAQTKNLAKYLMNLSEIHNLPIVILGKQYKQGTDYEFGSPSVLISKFCNCTFDDLSNPSIFLTTDSKDYNFPEGSIIVDPLRIRKNAIHYGCI